MKKNYILLFLISLLLLGGMTLESCSDNENEVETEITVNDLPQEAQVFLNKYFPEVNIEKVEQEADGNITVYVVDLENGYEVVFNEEGDWTQVDAPEGMTVPSGIAPEVIAEYLSQNYSGYGINEINKTGYGYNVVLITDLILQFNESGELINSPM